MPSSHVAVCSKSLNIKSSRKIFDPRLTCLAYQMFEFDDDPRCTVGGFSRTYWLNEFILNRFASYYYALDWDKTLKWTKI